MPKTSSLSYFNLNESSGRREGKVRMPYGVQSKVPYGGGAPDIVPSCLAPYLPYNIVCTSYNGTLQ